MQSYRAKNGTIFNFNTDFSGNVYIRLNTKGEPFEVDGEDLLEVAAYGVIVPNKISKLEQADWKDIVGYGSRFTSQPPSSGKPS